MIHIRGLHKSFGDRPALRGIDLDVGQGERLTLVGPNGAGKTTLLRILATLSTPTLGSVQVAAMDLREMDRAIRRKVGFLSHQPLLYDDLSGEENLRFYGRMYDVPNLDARIGEMLRLVGMERSRRDLVRTYSRGMKQRIAIARALLHNPELLLLDEPFTGLDQQAADMFDAVLQDAGMGSRTIVLTTHDIERGLVVGQRIAVLVRGEIVYQMDERNWDLDRFRRIYAEQTTEDGETT